MTLSKASILSNLSLENLQLEVLNSVDSTNDYLKKFSNSEGIHICLAEQQTKGKGRMQRQWHSPAGENIYLSLRLTLSKLKEDMSLISLITALSLCDAIEKIIHLPNPLGIKWPNDVYYQGKKLAGILIELVAQKNYQWDMIIGVGVNVNMQHADGVNKPWTSLYSITNSPQDRNLLVATLIQSIIDTIEIFQNHGFKFFKQHWHKRDVLLNQNIKVMQQNKIYQGQCMGIDDKGYLQLKTDDEVIHAFHSGEASLHDNNMITSQD